MDRCNPGGSYCDILQGVPFGPTFDSGVVAPEDVVTGLGVGRHFYTNTETDKLYVFMGTVRTKVGWQILN